MDQNELIIGENETENRIDCVRCSFTQQRELLGNPNLKLESFY